MFWCYRCYAPNPRPDGPCERCGQPIEPPAGSGRFDRLVWALGHPDGDRAVLAARALGGVDDERTAGVLRGTVEHHRDPYVRAAALDSLVTVEGVDRLRTWLTHLADHGPSTVRRVARRAMTTPAPPRDDRVVVYLVRHGQTRLNAAGLLRGHSDVALDDVGVAEAHNLAAMFGLLPVGRLVSSPLRRALDTAGPIADIVGRPVEVDVRLIDRDYGPWTAKTRRDAEATHGTLDAAPGVEASSTVTVRVAAALDAIAERTGPPAVVVVGHDVVNRAAVVHLAPDRWPDPDAVPQRTGCWNRLTRDHGRWQVEVVDARPGDGQRP